MRYIISRAFAIAIGLIILLSSAFLIWHAMFANSDPVFKPFTTETTFPLVIRHIPVIIEPSILETNEWYHAQEYQLRLANEWAAQRMLETYEAALQKSLNDGNHSRAEFFRQRIEEIYDPCAARF